MGKTYYKNSKRFDEEQTSGRSGKHAKHSNNRKSGGMKTLNSYVEEDIDLDDDIFDDDIEMTDDITIQHIQNDTK
jgi:hypothetical protein